MAVTPKPKAQNKTTMPDENTNACKIPPRWFRKNETVIGIIGNTQGVKIAASPNPKAVIRNAGRPLAAASAGAVELRALVPALFTLTATAPGLISVKPAGAMNPFGAVAEGSTINVKDAVFFLGGRHWRSLQA